MGIDIYTVLVNRSSAVAIKQRSGADFGFLYDKNLVLTKELGIFDKDAVPVPNAKRMNLEDVPINNGKADLPQAAVFLFDADGKVVWSYMSKNYRVRPDTVDILLAAEESFGI